ncbi:MAG TPA: biopolymer transporter ExbD [Steroidobacteraceae bacterium]
MKIANPTMNTTPLIDVMLVLLVLLLLALPISTHKIEMNLPQGRPAAVQPEKVDVDIDADGRVFWNGTEELDDFQLHARFASVGGSRSVTQVQIWPDKRARYERVAQVLASAQRADVRRIALSPVPDG